jgi:hypothetical protein
MNEPALPPDDPLTRLLADHFRRQEEATDPGPLLDRIRRTTPAPAPRPVARPARRWLRWGAVLATSAAAAALLLAFVFLTQPSQARAEAALREARQTLSQPVERCYLVDIESDTATAQEPLPPRTLRIWTAGDRFRVEVLRGNGRWCWGRDRDGAVWFSVGPHRGLRIEPDEIGPGLQRVCDLYGLKADTLLGDLLAHCELQEDRTSGPVRSIRAVPHPGRGMRWLRSAVVELDRDTRAIRKLTLVRLDPGKGAITSTFTLIETRPIDDTRYRLEGHLTEPFQVYDRKVNPAKRREILSRWVGPAVDRWLPAPEKK